MEAMTAGLPIISTKCRGATELVEEGKNGYLVDFDDVEAMANRIIAATNNSNSAMKLSKNSTKKSRKYHIKNIAIEMQKIYKV